jgi:type IV secretory pathway VirB3-like protein
MFQVTMIVLLIPRMINFSLIMLPLLLIIYMWAYEKINQEKLQARVTTTTPPSPPYLPP